MQKRHKNQNQYFDESAISCRKYYVPYIVEHTDIQIGPGCRVLEVGCGIGGNLSVFADMGCEVTGVDIHKPSVEKACNNFQNKNIRGKFICSDILEYTTTERFELIFLHDALEHIPNKEYLLKHLKGMLSPNGVIYLGFPAWQMPFGGHQQMAKNRFIANFPYIHLLPRPLFRVVFRMFGESESNVISFLEIRDTRITMEDFYRLIKKIGFQILNEQIYLINPHYQTKFGLKPRMLSPVMCRIPYLRNFFATTCFYLLR